MWLFEFAGENPLPEKEKKKEMGICFLDSDNVTSLFLGNPAKKIVFSCLYKLSVERQCCHELFFLCSSLLRLIPVTKGRNRIGPCHGRALFISDLRIKGTKQSALNKLSSHQPF